MSNNLQVSLGPLKLKNPILTASGTFGYGEEYAPFYDVSMLGAVVVKGITLEPRAGNPMPRICETPSGMLNSIGLANVGVKAFIDEKLSWLRENQITTIVNISGSTIDEYVTVAKMLSQAEGIAAIEINVSCPNVKAGGIAFGSDPQTLFAVVDSVRKATSCPLITKLSPNVTDMVPLARAAQDAGSDILSVINTLIGMAIDVDKQRPVLHTIKGGLSGPAVKPVALRWVWELHEKVDIPLIGMGGVESGPDAVEFLLAGAGAVAVGTANFYDPGACPRILEFLTRYLTDKGHAAVEELVGKAHRKKQMV